MSVRHALLALLSEGPKYGLQLREEFEARTGEVWPLNVGQVYTTLQRLERDGLVESDGADAEGPQKGFRITKAGAEELAGWLRTPPDLSSPPRDELVMKVLVALRVPGIEVRDVIQVHRRYLIELMQQWTRIKEAEAESDMTLALVVDAELFRLDAVVRWLDAADGRIKRAAAQTTPAAAQTTPAAAQTTPAAAQMTPAAAQTTPAPAQTPAAQTQTQTTPAGPGIRLRRANAGRRTGAGR
jgi:DNA-binding PadR family transcriptional regulator